MLVADESSSYLDHLPRKLVLDRDGAIVAIVPYNPREKGRRVAAALARAAALVVLTATFAVLL